MNDITDISDAVFNSGLEKEATIVINGSLKTINVIHVNEYMRNMLVNVQWQGSEPLALAKSSDLDGLKNNRDTIKISGEHNNQYLTIREAEPNSKNLTLLRLSYD
jgi:hypothetical protein